jgi:hypothetical protein
LNLEGVTRTHLNATAATRALIYIDLYCHDESPLGILAHRTLVSPRRLAANSRTEMQQMNRGLQPKIVVWFGDP